MSDRELGEVRERLEAYVARVGAWRAPAITEFVSLSQGWESDVYGFRVEGAESPARDLVARLYVGEHSQLKAQWEAAGMRCLYAKGYPVPEVALVELDKDVLGTPFIVMEWVKGDMLWPVLGKVDAESRERLVDEFVDLQVQLHRLAWEPDGICGGIPRRPLAEKTASMMPFVERSGLTGLTPAMTWLEELAKTVAPIAEGIAHWDYHPANVILRTDGALVVIDWTQVEVTDPRFDLAWTLVLVGSQMGWEWRERLLTRYELTTGRPAADLRFFELFACARRLFSVVISLHAGPESLGMRPGATELMRKQLSALAKVYEHWRAEGGMRIEEVERMLEG